MREKKRLSRFNGLFFFLFAALLFAVGVAPAFAAESVVALTPSTQDPKKITLDLKGIDVVEALKIFSMQGNLDIVIASDIKGRVTLFLKDVDLEEALETLLVSNQLAYERKGNIIYVMTQREYEEIYGEKFGAKKEIRVVRLKFLKASEAVKSLALMKTKMGKVIANDGSNTVVLVDSPAVAQQMEETLAKSDIPTLTNVFELKYAKVADLKTKLDPTVTKDIGFLGVDERTNKIAVTELETKMPQIEKVIMAFDDPSRQVLIEAKILRVNLDDRFRLGVDWDGVFSAFHREFKLTSRFNIAARGTLNPGYEATIGSLGNTNYAMLVQALSTVGDTNLLSSPRVTVLNGQEAKILIGERQPYATNSVVQTTGSSTNATNLNFLDVGIKLLVTPLINRDGFVTMKIQPEVSSVTGTYTYGSPSVTVPIISKTEAETSITVKDGATIIIGGLIKDERTNTDNKVPLFGDLPLLGSLFRKKDKQVQKQELVIFITPHIITGATDYTEVPEKHPIGEQKFTTAENIPFQKRRSAFEVDPDIREEDKGAAPRPPKEKKFPRVSVPATAEEYYHLVKESILERLEFPPKSKARAAGRIQISFSLSPSGKLASEPTVKESSNRALDGPALSAVKKASPFPPFPSSMPQKEKQFVIDFVFE